MHHPARERAAQGQMVILRKVDASERPRSRPGQHLRRGRQMATQDPCKQRMRNAPNQRAMCDAHARDALWNAKKNSVANQPDAKTVPQATLDALVHQDR